MTAALLDAVSTLGERLVLAESIGNALRDAAGDEGLPPLVEVYCAQVLAIRDAALEVETLVRRGVGGVAPDIRSAAGSPTLALAGGRSVQERASPRPRKRSSAASK